MLSFGNTDVALKALYIVGFSDFCLLLGIILLWSYTGTTNISLLVENKIAIKGTIPVLSFLFIIIGALAKSGAMPFHTWIPDAASSTPAPIMAFIPASIDKLLGIYLLYIVCIKIFNLVPNTVFSIILIVIGCITIVIASLLALVQRNLMKLLAYHTVCGVGYMIIGIGSGTVVGALGGLFYMLNHAICKICLFLGGGTIIYNTGEDDFEKLGGLANSLPITFITFLITAIAISGIPSLNVFFSKWMVYQGIIELSRYGSYLWLIWLLAAMFGSAITLAIFIKITHSIFLGKQKVFKNKIKERIEFLIPTIVLSALCILFGVLVYRIPINLFLKPVVEKFDITLGFFSPGTATVMIVIGIVIGLIIYICGKIFKVREVEPFIGGEEFMPEMQISGTDFYRTISDIKAFDAFYTANKFGFTDFFNYAIELAKGIAYFVWLVGDRLIDSIWKIIYKIFKLLGAVFSFIHTGYLDDYLAWILIGVLVMIISLSI